MTATHLTPLSRGLSARLMDAAFRREPYFAGLTVALLVAAVPMLAAYAVDERTLFDVNVWVKPLKFELALIVFFGTLVLFAGWLPAGTVRKPWYRAFASVVVFCVVAEMIWIAGAAANGIESHFNDDTVVMMIIYAVMGSFAAILTSATLVYGVLFWRDQDSALHPVFRMSLVYGLISTFVLTVLVAGYLSQNGGHFVGGNVSDAEAFPLMGWSRDGGDLRVAHFFATHAMHVVPAVGFAASRILPVRVGHAVVIISMVMFSALVLFTFAQALMGQPFLANIG